MAAILNDYEEKDKNDICTVRTAVLAGLPVYFKEDASEVFRTSKEEELDQALEGAVSITAVIREDGTSGVPFNPLDISIVLEDQVAICNVKSWPDAVVLLFGLLYALHLSYPKKLVTFFEFVQKVLLNLEDGKLRPKLLALKNELVSE
ncbi:hypothetical protein SKAU_G00244140 [Synaphobranchus kaupii]|uniref:Uncharacterized protein n=1 Tax=Synaphobranchus kaupii TaxID=118154 RepID=A0A9Q1F1J8_SYNKA|nr:hypothetical protein SKAU_G00244140 [Synaphobranchus kaupii]